MLSNEEILIRLGLALLLGAVIGFERERKSDWTAGLRTHMMVCLGACLIMMVSTYGFSDILKFRQVTLDPSRVAAQVVSGIGFIGAGTILFLKKGTVHGLTTAAGLWTVAGIGLATGSGLFFAAFATTLLALLILWGLKPLEERYFRKYRHMSLRVMLEPLADESIFLKKILNEKMLKVTSFNVQRTDDALIFVFACDSVDTSKIDFIVAELKNNQSIREVYWSK